MASGLQEKKRIQEIEITLLLEGIYLKYGYDFRGYAKSSVNRRILRRMALSGFDNISAMQHDVLTDPKFFDLLFQDLSINVTEMFRDASFYMTLRKKVIPVISKKPFIKIWHAGCSSGEEVYSTAILLAEEKLYDKVQVYATDSNNEMIMKAKKGIYSLDRIRDYTSAYQKAGGLASFADYYRARYDHAIMNKELKKNVVFADHNLVTDTVFGEMDLIFCRNVLIYFSKDLQNRVIRLFLASLNSGGFLCLGSRESVKFSGYANSFEDFHGKEKIYRRK